MSFHLTERLFQIGLKGGLSLISIRRRVFNREIVVFKIKEDATHEQLMEASVGVSNWAKQQPGFIDRKLVRSVDGETYMEIVRWESLEQAVKAGELSYSSEECAPMFALIQMDGINFFHANSVVEAYADVAV